MRSSIMKCSACGVYTLKEVCPKCGSRVYSAMPPRYSPKDRFQRFRVAELEVMKDGQDSS